MKRAIHKANDYCPQRDDSFEKLVATSRNIGAVSSMSLHTTFPSHSRHPRTNHLAVSNSVGPSTGDFFHMFQSDTSSRFDALHHGFSRIYALVISPMQETCAKME